MADQQPSLSEFFTEQHREADEFWAEVESAVEADDPARVSSAFSRFDRCVRKHLLLEEELLFPEFERATGIVHGPTMVMNAEHRQIRALLDQMQGSAEVSDHDALMDAGDTLLTLVQQHNMKEEGMLYPMSEQALQARWLDFLERLRAYG